MIIVADATPLRYLIIIDAIDVLPALYERIYIPQHVADELQRPRTPLVVRRWMTTPPPWLAKRVPQRGPEVTLHRLDAGEREVITLAQELHANLIIMDDWDGRAAAAAEARAFTVLGTLGVLDAAPARRLVALPEALRQLQATNFRMSPEMVHMLLERDAARQRGSQSR